MKNKNKSLTIKLVRLFLAYGPNNLVAFDLLGYDSHVCDLLLNYYIGSIT